MKKQLLPKKRERGSSLTAYSSFTSRHVKKYFLLLFLCLSMITISYPETPNSPVSTFACTGETALSAQLPSGASNAKLFIRPKDFSSDLEDFSIIVLGDTQHYTYAIRNNPSANSPFKDQTNWIVNNRAARNIKFVTHVGDVIEYWKIRNDPNRNALYLNQFSHAKDAMYLLEDPVATGLPEGIPYAVARGNHDTNIYTDPGYRHGMDENFGPAHFADKSYYGGFWDFPGWDFNSYTTFSAGPLRFLHFAIDFGIEGGVYGELEWSLRYKSEVSAWMNGIADQHPDHLIMVTTHYALNDNKSLAADGQWIYDQLKHRDNFFLVNCGHKTSELNETLRVGQHPVHILRTDYQNVTNPGARFYGSLRILDIKPSRANGSGSISIKTYSPTRNITESSSSLDMDFEPYTWTQLVSLENLASQERIATLATDLLPGTAYEWFVERDGVAGPTWEFTTPSASYNVTPNVQISGSVFVDLANAGSPQSQNLGELGREGIEVGLFDAAGHIITSTLSEEYGSFTIDLCGIPGTYQLRVLSQNWPGQSSAENGALDMLERTVVIDGSSPVANQYLYYVPNPTGPEGGGLSLQNAGAHGVTLTWNISSGTLGSFIYKSDSLTGPRELLDNRLQLAGNFSEPQQYTDPNPARFYWIQHLDQGISRSVLFGPLTVPEFGLQEAAPTPASRQVARGCYGYEFSPSMDGEIQSLTAHFAGTQMVRIYDGGHLLYQGMLTSGQSWTATPLETPVRLWKERVYTVAVYIYGTPSLSHQHLQLPLESRYITYHRGLYGGVPNWSSAETTPSYLKPSVPVTTRIYGMVDVNFVPYLGHAHFPVFDSMDVDLSIPLNAAFNYGFRFRPKHASFAVELGGRFTGNALVTLYDVETQEVLASTQVDSQSEWKKNLIDPVLLQKDKEYYVSIFYDGRSTYHYGEFDEGPSNTPEATFEGAGYGYSNQATMPFIDYPFPHACGVPDVTLVSLSAREADIVQVDSIRRGGSNDGIGFQIHSRMHIDHNLDGTFDEVLALGLGPAPEQLLRGDWNGDGYDTLAVRQGNAFLIDTDNRPGFEFAYSAGLGAAETKYFTGDWDGDGKDSLAIQRGLQLIFGASPENASVSSVITLPSWLGAGDILAGDWSGSGGDHWASRYYGSMLYDTDRDSVYNLYSQFGTSTDLVITGDWDGDGKATLATYHPAGLVKLDNNRTPTVDQEIQFQFE